MKVIVVIGGHYYAGYDPQSLKIFPNSINGEKSADEYANNIINGVINRYDRVYQEIVEIENAL